MTAITDDVNLAAAEWGSYEPGGRIEIEPFGWDVEAQSGLGPGMMGGSYADRYSLVQRANPSPHPMTWRSEAMSYEQAQNQKTALRIAESKDRDEALSYVPHLTMLAFEEHHGPYGCRAQTSLRDCPTHKCVDKALASIKAIIEDRDRIEDVLRMVEKNHDPAT